MAITRATSASKATMEDLADDVAEEPGAVHVPRRDVGADAMAPVFVLGANRAAGSRREDRARGAANGDLRLLVGADDEFVGRQRAAVPAPVM